MVKTLLHSIGIGLLAAGVAQGALQVSANVQPRLLNPGEAAQYTIEIRGASNPQPPQLPKVDGVRIQGPGTSSRTSIINGQVDRSTAYTWNIIPYTTGDITIPGFTYRHGTESVNLAPVQLTVAEADHRQEAELLFVSTQTPATNVYEEQMFEVVYSLHYRQLNLGRELEILGLPEGDLERISMAEIQGGRRQVDDKIYEVRRFRIVFKATHSGPVLINPTLRIRVGSQGRGSKNNSPFGDAFGPSFGDLLFGGTRYEPYNVNVEPITIQVHSVPDEGRPRQYSGAVGQFTMDAKASPADLSAGDPVTISIRIEGQGNIDTVSAPKLDDSQQLKLYDARLIRKSNREDGLGGTKEFEQVVIPMSEEVTEIPALHFSFFDPQAGVYRELTQGPFPVVVTPSQNARMTQAPSTEGPTQTIALGSDIIYLKGAPRHSGDRAFALLTSPLFWLVQALAPVALSALFLWRRRRDALAQNVAQSRRLKAPKKARSALKTARDALAKEDATACAEALYEAISAYFSDRLNISPGQFEATRLEAFTSTGRLAQEHAQALRETLLLCETLRYGGEAVTADLAAWKTRLERVHTALNQCERIKL